ncbi:hypothetical protein BAUCODRAFT_126113 [Baudoinia panamericana UAMH 10762]|uniref:Transcription factor domain-containing protein n=1 Tax=Baudoinia panamericana (strain UAMH 10762) TaxID=717646 RepID=M2ML59_BAUPA|nr:uncharacterized protein BAUCODRAFT_126113 [Baudoinia panamericana UAMH 10762]EMC92098.1 hypothetical protein BAUCODRAFT_126113 [Baudoinia panamericana UAMH 10762]
MRVHQLYIACVAVLRLEALRQFPGYRATHAAPPSAATLALCWSELEAETAPGFPDLEH